MNIQLGATRPAADCGVWAANSGQTSSLSQCATICWGQSKMEYISAFQYRPIELCEEREERVKGQKIDKY